MPYLFDESKLNYSGNKVAVRNLISVCNAYEEVYSNVRAQLTLAIDSVASWYSVWNGAFLSDDVSLNGMDAEHIQFLRQISVILDVFYQSMNSIVTASTVPITMETVSQRYSISHQDNIITPDADGSIQDTSATVVFGSTFPAKAYRELRLKFTVGRLHNIGVALEPNLPYDFQSAITATGNRYIGGRYSYKIGESNAEIIEIDLWNKTLAQIFQNAAQLDSKGTASFGTGATTNDPSTGGNFTFINVARSLARLKDQLNFSSGLLEDSRQLFNALL